MLILIKKSVQFIICLHRGAALNTIIEILREIMKYNENIITLSYKNLKIKKEKPKILFYKHIYIELFYMSDMFNIYIIFLFIIIWLFYCFILYLL